MKQIDSITSESPYTNSTIGKPKVTVCVPTYNRAHYLRQCLGSICAQTYKDFELLVVDNASTDETQNLVQSYPDVRLRYIRNHENLGMVGNWNRCLELATGTYIAIFHDDDIYEPNILETEIEVLNNNPSVGLVCTARWLINETGDKVSLQMFDGISQGAVFIMRGTDMVLQSIRSASTLCPVPSVMVRRECYDSVGIFDENCGNTADNDMWLRIGLQYDIAFVNLPLFNYRKHSSNESRLGNKSKRALEAEQIFSARAFDIGTRESRRAWQVGKQTLCRFSLLSAANLYEAGNVAEALDALNYARKLADGKNALLVSLLRFGMNRRVKLLVKLYRFYPKWRFALKRKWNDMKSRAIYYVRRDKMCL